MFVLKKVFKYSFLFLLTSYILFLVGVYFYQEQLIFHPSKLPKDYTFKFDVNHEEIGILTEKNDTINSLYFFIKRLI